MPVLLSLRRAAVLTALPVALVAGPLGAGPAAAGVVDRGTFDESGSDTATECGRDLLLEFTSRGSFVVRDAPGGDGQAFLATTSLRVTERITDLATGDVVHVEVQGVVREVSATHLEGDVYAFVIHETGVLTVRDDSGAVVLRDVGTTVYRQVFDTLGDGQPGGVELERELVERRGSFQSDPDDFCGDLDAAFASGPIAS